MNRVSTTISSSLRWIASHPARAGSIAGWYQQACGLLAGVVAVPLIIARLEPVEAGLWFSFQSVLALVALTEFGLSYVIARQVSFSLTASEGACPDDTDFILTRTNWQGVSDVYQAGRVLFRWLCCAGLIVLILVYHVLLPMGKLLAGAAPTTTPIAWYLLGMATLVALQTKPHQAILDGLAELHLTRFLSGTYQIFAMLGVVCVILLGGRLVGMAICMLVSSVLHYGTVRLCVRWRTHHKLMRVGQLPPGLLRRFVKVAAPMGVLNISSFMVSSVQVPLLGSLLGPQVVPAFYLAQKVGQMLTLMVMQILHPQLPFFTQEVSAGRLRDAMRRMRNTVMWITLLALGANVFFYFCSPFLIYLLVGSSRYVGSDVLAVMAVDYFILSAAVVWGYFVLASGSNPFAGTTFVSGIINICLCCLLVPRLGILGVPLATLASGLCINYWYNPWKGWQLYRKLMARAAA